MADGLDRFFDEYAPARLALGRMSPTHGCTTLRQSRSKTLRQRPALGGRDACADVGLLGHKTAAMADRYVRSVGSPVADAREAIGAAMAAAMAGEGARE